MEFTNVPADAGSLVLEHVKGHGCGYVPNTRTDDDDVKQIDARCIAAYRVPAFDRPSVKITLPVLDVLNDGSNDLRAVQKVRRILEAAGLKVALHNLEAKEAKRLREAAVRFMAEADALDGGVDG